MSVFEKLRKEEQITTENENGQHMRKEDERSIKRKCIEKEGNK
jgi:hypothetical protein